MNVQQMISRTSLCFLVWCTFVVAPTLAQTITHVPRFTFNGDSARDLFGSAVRGAGDVNGDGVGDLIVGAIFDGNNGHLSGSARVLSGSDGSVLYNFDGDSAGDLFGSSVSGAGDVNGDGFADLIVGAPEDDNNGYSSGSARVFSGVDGSVLYDFDGNPFDDFGSSVSGAGDVNGDGFDDLIVGALLDNNGISSGSARVLSGVDGSVLYNFDGDSADDRFGSSVSGAGDVNGDGFADVIVGAYGDDNNGSHSGSARVFSGADGSVLYTFDGDSEFDFFGDSVSGAGDVNGDGFDDLIVAAPSSARLFSGIDGSVLYDFGVDSSGNRLNASVIGVGDVNGDGAADFIVGAKNGGSARLFISQPNVPFMGNLFIQILQIGDDVVVTSEGVIDTTNLEFFSGIGIDRAGGAVTPAKIAGHILNANLTTGGPVEFNSPNSPIDLYFNTNYLPVNGPTSFGLEASFSVPDTGFGDLHGFNANPILGGDTNAYLILPAGYISGDLLSSQMTFLNSSFDDIGVEEGTYVWSFADNEITLVIDDLVDPILGDANLDGVVDLFDIAPFIGLLTSDTFLEQADCNQDGEVNLFDIAPFISILTDN